MKKLASVLVLLLLLPFASAELENNLENHVRVLSESIGERNYWAAGSLNAAADYITNQFTEAGYDAKALLYSVQGAPFANIQAIKKGGPEIIVIGAHYDTMGNPGADDNGSGIAVLLELARLAKDLDLKKTIHFVAFSTEEPPFYKSPAMGSYNYAQSLQGENIVGMISLEMVGYYSDEPNSQQYPLFYGIGRPKQGNYIGVISDFQSRAWKTQVTKALKQSANLPVESAWLFRWIAGADWSDHWSFWQHDIPALMITDTGPYRNPYYHRSSDTSETLDYYKMAELTRGLEGALKILAD